MSNRVRAALNALLATLASIAAIVRDAVNRLRQSHQDRCVLMAGVLAALLILAVHESGMPHAALAALFFGITLDIAWHYGPRIERRLRRK